MALKERRYNWSGGINCFNDVNWAGDGYGGGGDDCCCGGGGSDTGGRVVVGIVIV